MTLQDIEISEQIGARISGIRYNIHNANQAYIQNTALVFFTNSSGLNGRVTDWIERMRISPFGDIGIGTFDPKIKLDENGVIRVTEVKVETGWADFVFAKDYIYVRFKTWKITSMCISIYPISHPKQKSRKMVSV